MQGLSVAQVVRRFDLLYMKYWLLQYEVSYLGAWSKGALEREGRATDGIEQYRRPAECMWEIDMSKYNH